MFVDKSLICHDCGTAFIFNVAEQEEFASRGYAHAPKRCQSCRDARKARQQASNDRSNYRTKRSMHSAICAQCGMETQVPFEPSEGRPVYCRDCYSKIRATSR